MAASMDHRQAEAGRISGSSSVTPASFRPHEAERFFAALAAPANNIDDAVFVMASFGEGLRPEIVHVQNDEHAIQRMMAWAEKWTREEKNVYACLSLMRPDLPPGSKGRESDIVAVLGVACDFDGKHDPSTYARRLPLPPSCVVETSSGNRQAFYFFEAPVSFAEAKPLAVNLTKTARCDPTSADASHVFRVPGTMNFPSGKKIREGRSPIPQPSRLLECKESWEPGPSLPELEAALDAMSARSSSADRVGASESDTTEKCTLLPAEIEAMLYGDEGDRSAQFAGFVWSCRERRYTQSEVIALAIEHIGSPVVLHFDSDKKRIEADVKRLWLKPGTSNATSGVVSDPSDHAELKRLAALAPLEYERERENQAKRLGCRVGVLDDLVDGFRDNDGGSQGQGRAFELRDPVVWNEPVSGEELLDEVVAAVKRYIVMDDASVDALALWIAATYFAKCFLIFPRLALVSPEKGCGKTTALDVISQMTPRSLLASNITAAAIFRTIECAFPTLFIDEADTFLPENEEMRGILNSGHRADGQVIRCVGDDSEPRVFSTYCPAAIAAIGKLPGTLEDRSIMIRLRRRKKHEKIERLRMDHTEHFAIIAQKGARFARDASSRIRSSDPVMPDRLLNRAADNWRPLLAVADAAGGEWPERARQAAVAAIQASQQEGDQSFGVQLLRDLKTLFVSEDAKAISTAEIIGKLVNLDDRLWCEYSHGKPITPTKLAALLRPFGVYPGTVRVNNVTLKGYKREALDDAFERYLQE